MRLHEMTSPLLALIAGLCIMRPVAASFIPNFLQSYEDLQDVRKRCDNPCGYYGQLCCQSGETCYTDGNNQAQCGAVVIQTQAAADSGDWQYLTTTYIMTDLQTITTTISWQDTQPTQASCNECNRCQYSLGETPCGNVCCKSGQYCQNAGMCVAVGGGSSGFYSSIFTETVLGTITAPARPTSDTYVTVTSTDGGIVTTTQGYIAPSGTNGAIVTGPQPGNGGGGLSGGAIAGIVIGVIAAIIILLLICACCCFKGLIDGLLGIFGLGPRRRRRTEEVEVYESRHHHGSRTGGRTWFGTRPGRKTSVDEKKDGSGWGRIAGVSAFLGGMALLLGMKRKKDRKDDKSSAGYGSSYYSDYTSSE
jgi:hypothetical protein